MAGKVRGWRVMVAAVLSVATATGITTLSSSAHPAGASPRPLPPGPVYGVTIDDVGNLAGVLESESALGRMPMTRVYLDVTEPPSYYGNAVAQLHGGSYVMGEVLDSADMKSVSVVSEQARVSSLLSTLGGDVDVWEVGNEVNGNWTGPYSTGSQMVVNTYNQVVAAGGRTALTLYYNVGCGDGASELDPVTYSNQYLPLAVRDGLNYVFLSYYQTQCNDQVLSATTVTDYMQRLHAIFPNALLGFGEVGLPNPAKATTQTQAVSIIDHYYSLTVDLPYYVGGYFYWYYDEDAVPYQGNPIWSAVDAGMAAEASALGGYVEPSPASPLPTTTSTTSPPAAPVQSGPTGLFSSMPIGNLPVPGPYAGWGVPWTGFGTVAISPAWSTRVLTMTPAKATMPSVTHSALVTSQASFDNVAFKVVEQTTAQLRTGSTPNPWEVAWVLWDYTNSDNFYALVLKPNGWELDKVTGGVQHFLATGSGRKFPIGSKYSVVINQAGGRLSVSVNSRALVTYTDTSPTALDGGSIGLYCEDSAVRFGDVTLG